MKFQPDPENYPDYFEEKNLKTFPEPHNVWDLIVIDEGDITVGDLNEWFKSRTEMELSALGVGKASIYMSWNASAKEKLVRLCAAAQGFTRVG